MNNYSYSGILCLHPNFAAQSSFFEENEIFIVQFPRGKALSSSKGKIKKITHSFLYEFSHSSSTDRGSSGSPIILKGRRIKRKK